MGAFFYYAPDFALARQKDQNAAFGAFLKGADDKPGDCLIKARLRIQRARQPAGFNRKGATGRGDKRRIPHQRGDVAIGEPGHHIGVEPLERRAERVALVNLGLGSVYAVHSPAVQGLGLGGNVPPHAPRCLGARTPARPHKAGPLANIAGGEMEQRGILMIPAPGSRRFRILDSQPGAGGTEARDRGTMRKPGSLVIDEGSATKNRMTSPTHGGVREIDV